MSDTGPQESKESSTGPDGAAEAAAVATSNSPAPEKQRGPLFRFLFVHEIDDYPTPGKRTAYLGVAVLATIILYYTYYTQTGVTPNILRSYHMTFKFYIWVVIVSNLLGAFASLPASKTDKLGRANVIIYGLLIVGVLVAVGVPLAHTEWQFMDVICAIGLVEGAILVATPAMVRDFSPQLGRASAMGFWTVGPVAGSLITSIVANRTLSHFTSWTSQFIISGVTALVVFLVALFFMKDMSSRLRDQLMVSSRDQTLVEARARGLSEEDLVKATSHPWRQILKWDLVSSSFGIAVFLLIYYAAAALFTIYYSVTFLNANGTNYTTSQVNGLNTWFWGADIISLILVGVISDRLRVRKPFMLLGTIGSGVTLMVFLGLATHPHTSYGKLAFISCVLAFFLSMAYAPWMAGYTETVESKNPALVATGLALWGWILRVVVGVSFIILPLVITSVNPIVDNQPLAVHEIDGVPMQNFVALHPAVIKFAKAQRPLLRKLTPFAATLLQATKHPTLKNDLKVVKDVGLKDAEAALGFKHQLQTLVLPYRTQLQYLTHHFTTFQKLTKGVKQSPKQWQKWFWIDILGMLVFIPTIFAAKGRWSPKRARLDKEEHDQSVAEALTELGSNSPAPDKGDLASTPAS